MVKRKTIQALLWVGLIPLVVLNVLDLCYYLYRYSREFIEPLLYPVWVLYVFRAGFVFSVLLLTTGIALNNAETRNIHRYDSIIVYSVIYIAVSICKTLIFLSSALSF